MLHGLCDDSIVSMSYMYVTRYLVRYESFVRPWQTCRSIVNFAFEDYKSEAVEGIRKVFDESSIIKKDDRSKCMPYLRSAINISKTLLRRKVSKISEKFVKDFQSQQTQSDLERAILACYSHSNYR